MTPGDTTPGAGLRIYHDAVAIVTGGASGIGAALGEALARRGASVLLADLQFDLVASVAERIRQTGGKAEPVHLDVTDAASVCRVVEETVATHGRLDFIFNNAGIGIGGEVRHHQLDDWKHVLDVNLHGVIHGIHAAYPVMCRQGFGHIVNTASMAGLFPCPLVASYSAAKYAVVGLSLSMRPEAARLGVRVSVLCPGVVRTPILDGGKFGKHLKLLSHERLRAQWEQFRPIDPHVFAERALRAIARNQAIIIVPGWWRVFWWLNRISPWLVEVIGRRGLSTAQCIYDMS